MPTTSLSMRLPENIASQLENLAQATGRTKSFLAIQAIQDFIKREAWQISEIQEAIREADAGDFASESEVALIDKKWNYNAN